MGAMERPAARVRKQAPAAASMRRARMADLEPTADLELSAAAGAGGELHARLVVPAGHPLLAGHFPGAPLVPGVLLLDAARRAWERATGCRAALAGIEEARWFVPVAPGTEVRLRARVEGRANGVVTLVGEWAGGAGRVATFTLRLAEASR
jgi:3-hydroxymyristoyl/3-hydroxydecanoyl-(acyl carrier protein) dehydratase